jgi:hypothetical protein
VVLLSQRSFGLMMGEFSLLMVYGWCLLLMENTENSIWVSMVCGRVGVVDLMLFSEDTILQDRINTIPLERTAYQSHRLDKRVRKVFRRELEPCRKHFCIRPVEVVILMSFCRNAFGLEELIGVKGFMKKGGTCPLSSTACVYRPRRVVI